MFHRMKHRKHDAESINQYSRIFRRTLSLRMSQLEQSTTCGWLSQGCEVHCRNDPVLGCMLTDLILIFKIQLKNSKKLEPTHRSYRHFECKGKTSHMRMGGLRGTDPNCLKGQVHAVFPCSWRLDFNDVMITRSLNDKSSRQSWHDKALRIMELLTANQLRFSSQKD